MKENNFKCHKCKKEFTSRYGLQKHQLKVKCNSRTRNGHSDWNKTDLEYLVKNYELEDKDKICKVLKRNWKAIQRKANLLYLIRNRRGDTPIIKIGERVFSYYINPYGYMVLWDRSFPNGYKFAHRYIWEQENKKLIPEFHSIHHKDGNTINNDINNLELVDNKSHYVNGAISRLAKDCFEISDKNGFWGRTGDGKPSRNIPEALCLIVSEISEAMEAYRNGNLDGTEEFPDNMEEELGDAMIRLLDLSYGLGLHIENAVVRKIEKNKNRGYKHGKSC